MKQLASALCLALLVSTYATACHPVREECTSPRPVSRTITQQPTATGSVLAPVTVAICAVLALFIAKK